MGQDGTWGDHLTLIAVANMYHVSIVIVSSIEDIQPIVINPESGQSEGTILLGHIAELHYVTLQRLLLLCYTVTYKTRNVHNLKLRSFGTSER